MCNIHFGPYAAHIKELKIKSNIQHITQTDSKINKNYRDKQNYNYQNKKVVYLPEIVNKPKT